VSDFFSHSGGELVHAGVGDGRLSDKRLLFGHVFSAGGCPEVYFPCSLLAGDFRFCPQVGLAGKILFMAARSLR